MNLLYSIDRDHGLDFERSLETEWLETNGLGDYASSSLLFCPTRRQHGLLVVRPEGSERRHVFLSRFEEEVHGSGVQLPLTTTGYPDTWYPAAGEHLEAFELAPHPRTHHRAGELEVTREVCMPRGRRAVLLRYVANANAVLELRPFLPFREADSLTVENEDVHEEADVASHGVTFHPYDGMPALHISASAELEFVPRAYWYNDVDLPRDRERGYPAREDHFSPGLLRIPLVANEPVVVGASLEAPLEDPRLAWSNEKRRRTRRLGGLGIGEEPGPHERLLAAADDFLVSIDGRLGIDAGYPWFTEWGRDTFIALPGLTLARGDLKTCERILGESLEFLRDGLLPNVFGTSPTTSHYNSVDASLWFARAVLLYARAGGSAARVKRDYAPALLEIAERYWEGTGLDIRADEGGLLHAGSDELNVTWMDARTSAGPVTPRAGCAVEINALWYSLLKHVEELSSSKADRPARKRWRERRLLAKRTFLGRFWLEKERYLADVWEEGRVDRSVRPNMVLAAALEYSPLVKAQRLGVVERARTELLTPRGLRTLSPKSEAYRPRYEKDPEERDGAYHQGTVWPWLFGFYVEAALRARGNARGVRDELRATWSAIAEELDQAGLNHVSEVFDGDEPRRPGGTMAQAWNTAELLRSHALLEKGRR